MNLQLEKKPDETYEDFLRRIEAVEALRRKFEKEDELKARQAQSQQLIQPPRTLTAPLPEELKCLLHFMERKFDFNLEKERILIAEEGTKEEEKWKRELQIRSETSKKVKERVTHIFYS
jgi:hypothetical protein